MDPAHPLLESVRVPRDVVIDHLVAELEVDGLATRLGRHHDLRLAAKQLLLLASPVDRERAIDDGDLEPLPAQLTHQEAERVLCLGEDEELLAPGGQPLVAQDGIGELDELGLAAAAERGPGMAHEPLECVHLGLQLIDRLGVGQALDERVLDVPARALSKVVQVVDRGAGQEVFERGVFIAGTQRAARLGGDQGADLVEQAPQTLVATAERGADGREARGQAALQDRHGEADVALLLLHRLVEVLGDILGDRFVEIALGSTQVEGDRLHRPLRKQRCPVEAAHLLLETSQDDGVVLAGHGLLEDVAVREEVLVEQLEQQAEVLGVALVRGGRQEQQVLGADRERLAQAVETGLAGLLRARALAVGRHLVGLVHDHQVPVGLLECVEHGVACRPVDRGDAPIGLGPGVAPEVGLEHALIDDPEILRELLGELLLPLTSDQGRDHDEDAVGETAKAQLLEQQTGHDGLAGTGVVSEQEAHQRRLQHIAIDRVELVRQRCDGRDIDREVRVVLVGETDAERLDGQLEGLWIAREVHALGAGQDPQRIHLGGGDDDSGIELPGPGADRVDLQHGAEVVDAQDAHRLRPQRPFEHHVLLDGGAHVEPLARGAPSPRSRPASAMLKVRGPATMM